MGQAEQLQAVGNQLAADLRTCQGKLQQVGPSCDRFLNSFAAKLIPADVKAWISSTTNSFINACSAALGKIGEFLHGLAMPVMALVKMWNWLDVQKEAARISEAVDPASNMDMKLGNAWKGPAATAYAEAIKPQSAKAKRISDNAGKVSLSLGIVGAAGLAFYIALGVIVVKFIAACATAIAAFASAVFSWAGLALIVEEAAVNSGMIIAAVTTLTACLAAQAQQAATIKGDIESAFPAGVWPPAASAGYSDASMGHDATGPKDDSDWRLQ